MNTELQHQRTNQSFLGTNGIKKIRSSDSRPRVLPAGNIAPKPDSMRKNTCKSNMRDAGARYSANSVVRALIEKFVRGEIEL